MTATDSIAASTATAATERASVRLDWNESPIGPSPVAVERVRAHAADLHRYPRGLVEEVTAAIARDQGVAPGSVLLTNGVDEAADLLMAVGGDAWSVQPGFDGYADRADAVGATAHGIPLDHAWEPAIDAGELAGRGPVFLDQPHNPTGRFFDPDWTTAVLRGAALVCLDATYAWFADPPEGRADDEPAGEWDACRPPGVDRGVLAEAMATSRLAVFHSFSKSHGLAGLRVGALVASPALIARLARHQRFLTVDTVSLHALAGSLDDRAHRRALRRHVVDARRRYVATLADSPLLSDVHATQANFVLARGGDGAATTTLVARLGRRGAWVKDCAPLGLPGWMRVTVGDDEALDVLLAALRAEEAASAVDGVTVAAARR